MSGGGGVGAQGQLNRGSNGLSPGIKYRHSKIALAVTSIALSLGRPGTQLLQLPAQSLTGSPSTLRVTVAERRDYALFERKDGLRVRIRTSIPTGCSKAVSRSPPLARAFNEKSKKIAGHSPLFFGISTRT